MNLTATERHVIDTLIQVARTAWHLADNTEDDGSESLLVDRESFTALSYALDILAELPDDRPGYVLGEAGKAEWALRRILEPNNQQQSEAVATVCLVGERYAHGNMVEVQLQLASEDAPTPKIGDRYFTQLAKEPT